MSLTDVTDGAGDLLRNFGAFAHDIVRPTVRLGVTGLSRSGKTVFITALIHNLIAGGRLPFFDAVAQGRIIRAYLEPQPDDDVPRFAYERHLEDLTGPEPTWPQGTRRISQVRVTVEYISHDWFKRQLGPRRLHIDIVDYPGEWLLDLPLLDLDYAGWSAQALELASEGKRADIAQAWVDYVSKLDPRAVADEQHAVKAAELFKAYLAQCREDAYALSTVPPGRFLMPGDMEGSPALTFAPLPAPETRAPDGSLWAMMERRFEAYKTHVVKPFYRDHFARLDRQIVLVDTLQALNAGGGAMADLERALVDILQSFRPGANSWLSSLFYRRIERILFAATKADHLHHLSHPRLKAILARLTSHAAKRATFAGADIDVAAIAAVRATREARMKSGREEFPCIIGRPLPGERIGAEVFDGEKEFAVFPGDLPEDPDEALAHGRDLTETEKALQFIRFRPPDAKRDDSGDLRALPHIGLDQALQFLIGDRLA